MYFTDCHFTDWSVCKPINLGLELLGSLYIHVIVKSREKDAIFFEGLDNNMLR